MKNKIKQNENYADSAKPFAGIGGGFSVWRVFRSGFGTGGISHFRNSHSKPIAGDLDNKCRLITAD